LRAGSLAKLLNFTSLLLGFLSSFNFSNFLCLGSSFELASIFRRELICSGFNSSCLGGCSLLRFGGGFLPGSFSSGPLSRRLGGSPLLSFGSSSLPGGLGGSSLPSFCGSPLPRGLCSCPLLSFSGGSLSRRLGGFPLRFSSGPLPSGLGGSPLPFCFSLVGASCLNGLRRSHIRPDSEGQRRKGRAACRQLRDTEDKQNYESGGATFDHPSLWR